MVNDVTEIAQRVVSRYRFNKIITQKARLFMFHLLIIYIFKFHKI